jgi:hypothetical protein
MCVKLANIVSKSQDFISPQASSGTSTVDSKKRTGKLRYTQADLPFPRDRNSDGQGDYLNRWRTSFLPSLLSWAGAQDDPFRTNCRLSMSFCSEVAKIWARVYPESTLDDNGRRIVLSVVCPLSPRSRTQSQYMETNHDLVQHRHEYLA